MDLVRKNFREYNSNDYMTRKNVIPYYVDLIISGVEPSGEEVNRVNNLILSKWTTSGLLFIKDRAWREVKKFKDFNEGRLFVFKKLPDKP